MTELPASFMSESKQWQPLWEMDYLTVDVFTVGLFWCSLPLLSQSWGRSITREAALEDALRQMCLSLKCGVYQPASEPVSQLAQTAHENLLI